MPCESTHSGWNIASLEGHCECTAGEWSPNEEGISSASVCHNLCLKVAFEIWTLLHSSVSQGRKTPQ